MNPSPNNNSNEVDLIGSYLRWESTDPDDDELRYTIYFNSSLNLNTPKQENLGNPEFYPGTLQKDTKYYWKVVVIDQGDGYHVEGPIWHFTTTNNSLPIQPKKPYPANGQTNVNPCSLTLQWDCSDADDDQLYYTIFFDDSSNPSKNLVSGITSNSASAGMLAYDTNYHWSVEVTDNKGEVVKSVEWSFTTKPKPCKAFIDAPKDTYSGSEVTFSGSRSECESGLITSYQWDFGDGEAAIGETVTHVFRGNETFKVTLTINCKPDCLSCSDATTHSIHVGNHKPKKPEILQNDLLPFIGGQIEGTYSFKVKGTDVDGDQIRFRFDWGDNTSNTVTDYVYSGEEITVSHAWMNAGDYDIKIYAEDVGGDVSPPVHVSTSIGSAVNIAMIVIVLLGVVIVTVQVVFVVLAHRKKMFE
jgi:chitodextrinase